MNQIQIKDHDQLLLLDYAGLLAYHGSGALVGASIGFRAMEYAGVVLSSATGGLWDRKHLSVTTCGLGSGARDAIEYVTRCLTRESAQIDEQVHTALCEPEVASRFMVSHGTHKVIISLRTGVVARKFLDVAKRRQKDGASDNEREALDLLKPDVAAKVMNTDLESLFSMELKEDTVLKHA